MLFAVKFTRLTILSELGKLYRNDESTPAIIPLRFSSKLIYCVTMRGPTSSRNDVGAVGVRRQQCARKLNDNLKRSTYLSSRVRGEDDDDNAAGDTISIIVGGSSSTQLGWMVRSIVHQEPLCEQRHSFTLVLGK